MTNEEYQKLYEKEFPEGMTFKQVSDKLDPQEPNRTNFFAPVATISSNPTTHAGAPTFDR